MARILLVDDDLSIRRLLQTILSTDGHEVTTACDGNEGLRRVLESSFDLVITDLIMPDKEGLEMIREIRHALPHQKIGSMKNRVGSRNLLACVTQIFSLRCWV